MKFGTLVRELHNFLHNEERKELDLWQLQVLFRIIDAAKYCDSLHISHQEMWKDATHNHELHARWEWLISLGFTIQENQENDSLIVHWGSLKPEKFF